ncbi:MAG: hypothetical protein ACJ8BF_12175 [Gemmatimonadales bacterium]
MRRFAGLLSLGLVGLSACKEVARLRGGGDDIEVHWTGADQGKVSGTATAEWCSLLRLLEVQALAGDTGVALAIYPTDTLAAGKYPVMDPAKAESLPPAAGLALRWPTQTSIKGFQGESGSVVLERSGSGQLSGSVAAVARSITDNGRLRVTGTFRDLTVRPSTRGCVRAGRDTARNAPPADTLIH